MRICVGIDAAKTTHWAVGIEAAGNVVLDRAVENDPDFIYAQVLLTDGSTLASHSPKGRLGPSIGDIPESARRFSSKTGC